MDSKDLQKVPEAIEALKALARKQPEELIGDVAKIHLILGFKKPPGDSLKKFIKVTLPHSCLIEDSEVCLFVKDVDKGPRDYQPTIDKYEELFEEKKITCINTIIPLKSIKTEFKEYEAKINLARMYDAYLADERIIRLLPSFLGKHFHKKFPTQVNLTKKDLAGEIQRALRVSQCEITGRGSTSMMCVGQVGMETDRVVANVTEAVKALSAKIPGGSANIKSLHLKSQRSLALPIYMSLEAPTDVILPEAPKPKDWEPAEDVSTLEGVKVKVRPSTSEFKIVKAGRNEHKKEARKRRRQAKAQALAEEKAEKRKLSETPNEEDTRTAVSNKNEKDPPTPNNKAKKQKAKDGVVKKQIEPSAQNNRAVEPKKGPKQLAIKSTPKSQKKTTATPNDVAETPEEPKAKKQRVSVDSSKSELTPKTAKSIKTPKSGMKADTPKSARNRKISDSETPQAAPTPKTPKSPKAPKSIEKKLSAKKQMSAKRKSPKTLKSP